MLSRQGIAAMVDHTLLAPEATSTQVKNLIVEARELGVYAVCVSPSMLPIRAEGLVVATVAGFPSGKHHSMVKAMEAGWAAQNGAQEIDMVIDIAAALHGDYNAVLADVLAVREYVPRPVVLKVIVESALLSDAQLGNVCRAVEQAGADFVKTSTGFHPAGGATAAAVEVMAKSVSDHVGVKASGGIRTAADAIAMVNAGATRLGLSGTRAVLEGLD